MGTLVRHRLKRLAGLFRPNHGRADPTNLDLFELAQDVVAERRTLSNVIDQIAVATPDDRSRRDSVAQLQRLVVSMSASQSHAQAAADAATAERRPRRDSDKAGG